MHPPHFDVGHVLLPCLVKIASRGWGARMEATELREEDVEDLGFSEIRQVLFVSVGHMVGCAF